jgi:hypothetical protein
MGFLDWLDRNLSIMGGAVKSDIGLAVDLSAAKSQMYAEGEKDVLDNFMSRESAERFQQAPTTAANAGLTALNWGLEQVKETTSTLPNAAFLAQRESVQAGFEPGSVDNWRRFFNGDVWARAYERSQHNAGARAWIDMATQSSFVMEGSLADKATEQAGVKNRRAITDEELKRIREGSTSYNVVTGTGDLLIDFKLDPLIAVGKGAQLFRGAQIARPIKPGEDVLKAITEEPRGLARRGPGNLKSRTESVLSYVHGKSAAEIYYGVDGLKESTNGMAVATALAKAGKKDSPEEAQMVLRIAYGDSRAVAEMAQRDTEIADLLTKARMEANDILEANKWEDVGPGKQRYWNRPEIQEKYKERLANNKDYQKNLRDEADYHEWLKENVRDVAKTRTLRVTDKSRIEGYNVANSVIQKNLWSVPTRMWHSFTTQKQQGVVQLDAPDSVNEVKAMFDKVPDMDPGLRTKLLSEYMTASNPGAKHAAVNRAKAAVLTQKAKQYGYEPKEAETIVNTYLAEDRRWFGLEGPQRYSAAVDESGTPVDVIIDDDGVANVLPQFETQLANEVPTINVNIVDQALKRSKNRFQGFAAWLDEVDRLDLHGGARAVRQLDKARWGFDEASKDLQATLTKWWKGAVLARLGYPLRVLTDDHLRINAKLGSAAMALETELGWAGLKATGRGVTFKNYREARTMQLADKERVEEIGEELVELEGTPDFAVKAVELQDELAEVQARLKSADEVGLKKTYQPQVGKRLGEGEFEYRGVRATDAFGGADADLRRALASQEGMHSDWLEVSEKRRYNRAARSGGGGVRVEPEEPGHTEAWLHAVNKQLRQDRMAMKFIEGQDEQQVLNWLKRDTEGRQYAKQFPFHAANKERWVANAKATVDQYIPDANWRELLGKRQLQDKDIKDYIARGGKPPAVHGATIQANLGQGAWSRQANNFLNTAFKYLSEIPSDRLSRHPLYVALYRQRLKQEIDYILADPNRVKLGKMEGHVYEDDLQQVYKLSHAYALKGLKDTLYDVTAHSNAADALRFVSPFMGAWQETLGRWWGLAKEKPQIIQYFNMAWQMPNKTGLVVDKDGNPVDESSEITDDEYLRIQLPTWAGGPTTKDPLRKQWTLQGMQWSIPKSAFNITLQGDPWWLPGAGPILQIPVGEIAKRYPTKDKAVQEIYHFFNPYGYKDAWQAVQPATAKRIQSLFDETKARDFSYYTDRTYRAMYLEWEKGGRVGPEPTFQEAIDNGKALYFLRVMNNFVSPFPAQPASPYQFYQDQYNNLKKQATKDGRNQDWVDDTFIQQYGWDFFAFVQGSSQNNIGAPATVEAVNASKQRKELIGRFPDLAPYIIGVDGNGEYDEWAYAYQMGHSYKPGSSEPQRGFKDPAESQKAAQRKVGWEKYLKFRDKLNAMAVDQGLMSYRESPVLAELNRQATEILKNSNAAWREDFEQRDEGWFQRNFEATEKVAFDKQMDNQPGIDVLRRYVQTRQQVMSLLQARKAAGGTADPRAQSNRDLAYIFTTIAQKLAESNTSFDASWYTPFLERDPLMLDLTAVPQTEVAA